jgi:hypothetical protein
MNSFQMDPMKPAMEIASASPLIRSAQCAAVNDGFPFAGFNGELASR